MSHDLKIIYLAVAALGLGLTIIETGRQSALLRRTKTNSWSAPDTLDTLFVGTFVTLAWPAIAGGILFYWLIVKPLVLLGKLSAIRHCANPEAFAEKPPYRDGRCPTCGK